VRVDGRLKGHLPGSLVIDEGRHRIELQAGDGGRILLSRDLAFATGAWVEVAELLPESAPPEVVARLGAVTALAGAGRRDLAPMAASGGLEASRPLPHWPRLRLRAAVDLAHGDGAARVAGTSAPFTADLLSTVVGLAARTRRGRVAGEIGLDLGALYLRRSFTPAGAAPLADDGVGFVLAGRTAADYAYGRLRLGVGLELGGLIIGVGGETRGLPLARVLVRCGFTLP
jgi:hypothetical protein